MLYQPKTKTEATPTTAAFLPQEEI